MVHNLAAFIAGFFLLLCGVYLFACRLSLVRSSVHLGNSHLMLAAVLFIYGLMLQYMSVVGCYGVLKLDVTCLACFTKMTLLVAIGGLWLTFKYQDAVSHWCIVDLPLCCIMFGLLTLLVILLSHCVYQNGYM
jgi:hypothetical protein